MKDSLRIHRPALAAIVIPIAASVALVTPAYACSCWRGDDAKMQTLLADILKKPGAFIGSVEARGTQSGVAGHTTSFKVINRWVGAKGDTLNVNHALSSASCGVTFEPGQHVFLLASEGGTSLCSQMLAGRAKTWGKAKVRALAK